MRSSAILVAAVVGVASAGMPKLPLTWSATASDVYGGDGGPTGRLHFGPGPVSQGSFPTSHPKDYHMGKENHNSGGIFSSGGPNKHHPDKYRDKPTGSGIGPTGTGNKHHPDKHHHKPTGTGNGGPPPTPGPPTTTITITSDVTGK